MNRQTELFSFNGSGYEPKLDQERLTRQLAKVFNVMKGGAWKTLREISAETNAPEASASAQLRNLRKDRFGGHTVEKRRRGAGVNGLFEYKLILANV